MSDRIVLYGNLTCPQVAPVRAMLSRAGAEFEYIGLTWNPEARKLVQDINDGAASVPTLVFADGTTLTEPSRSELREKLIEQGYDVPEPSMFDEAVIALQHPLLVVFAAMLLAVGISSSAIWMLTASLVILGAVLFGAVAARMRHLR